jgi:hypothetical protein
MFIGHFAVAMAAKRATPRTSLGTLVMAAQFVDLLWPLFLLLGWEHVRIDPGNTAVTPLDFYDYPFSHSLLGAFVWSIVVGGSYFFIRRDKRGSLILAACVLSHWIFDFLTHRPDLLLFPGSSIATGLGLWNSVAGTISVEVALFLLGFYVYVHSTTTLDRIGTYGLWSFGVFLLVVYFANVFGPPPPSAASLSIVGNSMWLLVFWAFWFDRHRKFSYS